MEKVTKPMIDCIQIGSTIFKQASFSLFPLRQDTKTGNRGGGITEGPA